MVACTGGYLIVVVSSSARLLLKAKSGLAFVTTRYNIQMYYHYGIYKKVCSKKASEENN